MAKDKGGTFKSKAAASFATPSSIRDFYDRYRDELTKFARRKVGSGPPEPDDVVQQAFANFAGVEDPAAVKNPRAFLYRTVSNVITDYRRSAQHNHNVDVDDAELEELREEHDEISPEIVLLDRERFFRVEATIRSLPRRQRRFLLLNRLDGMSYTEIAARNGVSITTARREVESAIGACREAVRKMMTDDE